MVIHVTLNVLPTISTGSRQRMSVAHLSRRAHVIQVAIPVAETQNVRDRFLQLEHTHRIQLIWASGEFHGTSNVTSKVTLDRAPAGVSLPTAITKVIRQCRINRSALQTIIQKQSSQSTNPHKRNSAARRHTGAAKRSDPADGSMSSESLSATARQCDSVSARAD